MHYLDKPNIIQRGRQELRVREGWGDGNADGFEDRWKGQRMKEGRL